MKAKKPAIAVLVKTPKNVASTQAAKIEPLRIAPRYVGVADAELLTGISKWTWRTMCYDGRVASAKVGARLLIPMSEIDRIMTENLRPRAERA